MRRVMLLLAFLWAFGFCREPFAAFYFADSPNRLPSCQNPVLLERVLAEIKISGRQSASKHQGAPQTAAFAEKSERIYSRRQPRLHLKRRTADSQPPDYRKNQPGFG